ncbi:MAG: lipocalin family protein [Proteobacteria bacterium]|nr:lipocalin family protein [Pseudomonadota bacterium]
MRLCASLVLAAAVLSACAPAPQGLRNAGTPISSAAAFDQARFADVWHVVAAYGSEARCGPLTETWVRTGQAGYNVTGTRCGPMGARAFAETATISGPGRITRGEEQLWVLWVDADYRVAVIGTPTGQFARVLSRTPGVREDLMRAARDVLRFNGYDPAGLSPV